MSKYKLDKSAQVVEDTNYIMTQEEVCERLNNLKSQLTLTEKALELACEEINKVGAKYGSPYISTNAYLVDKFKTKAKKMVKK